MNSKATSSWRPAACKSHGCSHKSNATSPWPLLPADLKAAATDSNVSLILRGSHGDLGPLSLDKPGAFTRGSRDVFLVDRVASVGELKEAEVAVDGSGMRPSWHLESILVGLNWSLLWSLHWWLDWRLHGRCALGKSAHTCVQSAL